MSSRPRMAGTVKAKLSLDKATYTKHKAALKELESAVRKEIIEKALMTGGQLIYADAQVAAPGPGIVIRIIGGRSLRKRVDPRFERVVKANAKLVAIGPDAKHWHYRFFEFGATPHDIKAIRARLVSFKGSSGQVFVRSAKSTGGVRARPFLRPAVDKNSEASVKAMGQVLKEEIEKAAKKA